MRSIALGLALVVSAACARSPGPVAQAPEPDPVAVRALSQAVLAADDGDRLVQRAFDRLLEAPEVSAAGSRLFARLGDAPDLQPAYEGFLGELLGSAAFMAVIAQVATESPGTSPEAVAETLVARVDAAFDDPAFDAAIDGAIDRVFEEPAVKASLDTFASDLVDRSGAIASITAMLLAWQPDLEAAVGKSIQAPSFQDALSAYLAEPGRAAAIEQVVAERMASDPKLVQALAALVDAPGFFEITASRLREILDAPRFRADAVETLAAMVAGGDAATLERAVERLIVRPEVAAAMSGWFRDLDALPETRSLARALGQVVDDPATRAELYHALIGVPRGRTA